MKTYEWILFDADETLFSFDAFSGLQRMFVNYKIQFNEQDYLEYQTTNKALWVNYQNGEITAQQIRHQRFDAWSNRLQVSQQELNSAYMAAIAEICTPLEGAINLIHDLKDKAKLGIITNGFTELQHARLDRMGLRDHFEVLVISEQVGIAKPHRGIFDHALSIMGNPARERVLMVGDTPESDILGGINAGLHTCWLNVNNRPTPSGITPMYQISSLLELKKIINV